MERLSTLQQLFRRYRRPGDLVFAVVFLLTVTFLLTRVGSETAWIEGAGWYAQPRLWPAVSIIGMVVFGVLHTLSSVMSPRIDGRWREVGFWFLSLEFVFYFLIYVVLVPEIGYLPATILFTLFLSLRAGFFSKKMLLAASTFGIAVAIIFRAFLQVKIPAGRIYETLPDSIRAFALTYL
ncbi:MAG: tripartite tricarboxylate transporter TctB family protein [Geminicoccaceae bacterium]